VENGFFIHGFQRDPEMNGQEIKCKRMLSAATDAVEYRVQKFRLCAIVAHLFYNLFFGVVFYVEGRVKNVDGRIRT